MSTDPRCTALATAWLQEKGYTYSEDVSRLAERIDDTIEDFIAEMEERDEKEAAK